MGGHEVLVKAEDLRIGDVIRYITSVGDKGLRAVRGRIVQVSPFDTLLYVSVETNKGEIEKRMFEARDSVAKDLSGRL